jgi:hypothetical protein
MLNKYIDAAKEGKFLKNIQINESKSRQIKTIITSIVILSGVQGIESSKVLAFDIVPIEAVSTTLISHEYLGVGNSYDTFQINVSNYPGLDPLAQLSGFTLSLTPPSGRPPAPPNLRVSSVQTPLSWQLSEISYIPSVFYDGRTISIPTLTYQVIDPNVGIFPGTSLAGFGLRYSNGCGVYCGSGPSKLSVIATSSVPEPVTILGSAIALGFGINLKRKYSKTDSHKT